MYYDSFYLISTSFFYILKIKYYLQLLETQSKYLKCSLLNLILVIQGFSKATIAVYTAILRILLLTTVQAV